MRNKWTATVLAGLLMVGAVLGSGGSVSAAAEPETVNETAETSGAEPEGSEMQPQPDDGSEEENETVTADSIENNIEEDRDGSEEENKTEADGEAWNTVSGNESCVSEEEEKNPDMETERFVSLEVPANLDFTVDPWNLSGKGQIYSNEFTVCNDGNAVCVFRLQDIRYRQEGENGVTIVKNQEEIYAGNGANVYMEIVFGNGDILPLSEEGQEYEAVLVPGGELKFRFTGRVNEKTTESWEKKEVGVAAKYFWAMEE